MSGESSEEAEFSDHGDEEGEDADEPNNDIPKSGRNKRRVSYAEQDEDDEDDDEDDDSDDDIPLSQLAGKNGNKKKSPAKPAKKKKPANGTKKKVAPKPPPSSSGGSSKSFDSPSAAYYGTECDKGMLIQKLLCRWWYAYEWPNPDLGNKKPPENYDTLDGFPGVFVCTVGDNVGHILDTRDAATRPCFENFALKSSQELKELLLKAIEAQLDVLENHDHAHDTTSVQRELKDMRKWAQKLKPEKADKDAIKVLKASKLKLKEAIKEE